MTRLLFKLLFLILVSKFVFSQTKYPQNYFIPPLEIPIALSGTFGELRSDHFHSGIDLRTNEVEGHKIFAIADGWVSRIKVASGGYGKALYITHENGYTSVYGHLQSFNGVIGEYVIQNQYRLESFEIDLYLNEGDIPVSQGEIMGLSGNTGRSGGPHLHFEIRDENQQPINPLLFGYVVFDNTPPLINTLKTYPVDTKLPANPDDGTKVYYTQKKGSGYVLASNDTIKVAELSYFGINTFDPFNNGLNKNGVYSIRLLFDSVRVYEHTMEIFSFAETRYINSLIDYKEYKTNKRRVQKSYIDPNNKLSVYRYAKNRGILDFSDGKAHQLVYEVSDIAGNTSKLTFWAKADLNNNSNTIKEANIISNAGEIFSYLSNNFFQTDHLILQVPGAALYDSVFFTYHTKPALEYMLSDIHQLHYDYVPLHKWCGLSIQPTRILTGLEDKYLIAKIEENDFDPAGGTWENGYVSAQIREFGDYCILIDTIPPEIKPINVSENKNLQNQQSIRIKITDELSGIDTYRGTLNGNWILMEYDAKNDLLIYNFDDRLTKGQNIFDLEVADERKNTAALKLNLNY
jgi:hypothetical protein